MSLTRRGFMGVLAGALAACKLAPKAEATTRPALNVRETGRGWRTIEGVRPFKLAREMEFSDSDIGLEPRGPGTKLSDFCDFIEQTGPNVYRIGDTMRFDELEERERPWSIPKARKQLA